MVNRGVPLFPVLRGTTFICTFTFSSPHYNLHFRVNSLFHYLCSQCYAAQHSYILSMVGQSMLKMYPSKSVHTMQSVATSSNTLQSEILEILERIHDGHQGVIKCRERAKMSVWWPGISCEIQSKVSNCEFCQDNLPSQRKEPLITTPLPERVWKKIGVDLCEHEGKQFLVVSDYYSRFPEVEYMSSTTSNAVINKLKDIFARWGIPDEVVSDNGPQFSSNQFRKLV